MGREAEKPCLPGAEPKLTGSAKPQVQNMSNYPCFSTVKDPPTPLPGQQKFDCLVSPSFCLSDPILWGRSGLLASFGRVPGRGELPVLLIAQHCCCPPNNSSNCNAVSELHKGVSMLELDIASPCSDIKVPLID